VLDAPAVGQLFEIVTLAKAGIHFQKYSYISCSAGAASLGFAQLGDSLSFCLPKNKVSKEKGRPASPSMAKDAIDPLRASQVTARGKLAFGSNSFPLDSVTCCSARRR
jgi:hypothetical protein